METLPAKRRLLILKQMTMPQFRTSAVRLWASESQKPLTGHAQWRLLIAS